MTTPADDFSAKKRKFTQQYKEKLSCDVTFLRGEVDEGVLLASQVCLELGWSAERRLASPLPVVTTRLIRHTRHHEAVLAMIPETLHTCH